MTDSHYSTQWGCNVETKRGPAHGGGGRKAAAVKHGCLNPVFYLFASIKTTLFRWGTHDHQLQGYNSCSTWWCAFRPTGGQSSTGKSGISVSECSVFCRKRCPPADCLPSELLRGMSLFSNCSVTLSTSSLMAHTRVRSSALELGELKWLVSEAQLENCVKWKRLYQVL